MMDDKDGGVVVLWWCGFGEGSAFKCGSGGTNERMEHLLFLFLVFSFLVFLFFASCFLQDKIADSCELC